MEVLASGGGAQTEGRDLVHLLKTDISPISGKGETTSHGLVNKKKKDRDENFAGTGHG